MKIKYLIIGSISLLLAACSKNLVTTPNNLIITTAQFDTDTKANDAVVGIYSVLYGDNYLNTTYNSVFPIFVGLSADEMASPSRTSAGYDETYFFNNSILATNGTDESIWSRSYNIIYQANSVIDNVAASTGMSTAGKIRCTAEASFLRAFIYFYLVNMYGDVPLVTTSDYVANNNLPRTPVKTVYQQIITDLTFAAGNLSDTYFTTGRVRVNKSTAQAMLARVYLYTGDFANAQANATNVISDSQYSLEKTYATVFLSTSKEAIFQLYPTTTYTNYQRSVGLPYSGDPAYVVTNSFINSFETGDLRKTAFTAPTTVSGAPAYIANKYKNTALKPATVAAEYYMVLRLAEQYLIRAEALAQQSNITAAVADVNVIRARAGLTALPVTISQANLLLAIEQERRVELCFEWGDRWFNTKRTGRANAVFGTDKQVWIPTASLYPIPNQELINNQTLTQNPGY